VKALVLAAVLAAGPVASAADLPSPLERQVLADIDAARADPAAYARALQAYRARFVGRQVRDPDIGELRLTAEGALAVDDAVAALQARTPAPPLVESPLLARAAADLAGEQGRTGAVGHFGPHGESLADRVRRYGEVRGVVAEGISYGQPDAAAVVRALVVDDGVADRSHRRDLLDPHLRYAGVSCGPHPIYRTLCVIDYAGP
jgi:uncharacterized protein YkwD